MKTTSFEFLIVFFILLSTYVSSASCYHKNDLILPEILNDTQSDKDIFLIEVDTIFKYQIKTGAFAKVLKVFRGKGIGKRVRLISASGTTGRGRRLKIGKKYLVVGKTNGYHYSAFQCDRFSFELIKGKKNRPTIEEKWMAMIEYYFKLKNEKHTGYIELKLGNLVLGKGSLKNGIPNGQWHYFRKSETDDSIIIPKSDIFYKNGLPEGEVILYEPDSLKIDKQLFYRDGKLIKEDFFYYRNGERIPNEGLKYESYSDGKFDYKNVSFLRLGADGNEKFRNKVFPFDKFKEVRDGDYYGYTRNLKIKEKGQYFMGAKVGTWITYDTLGNETNREEFSFPDTSIAEVIFFSPEGDPIYFGNLKNGKQNGEWKIIWKNFHTKIWNFEEGIKEGVFGILSSDNTFSTKGFFKNNRINGDLIEYNSDGSLKSKTYYKNNLKEGLVKQYHPDGSIKQESTFQNGFLHGDYIHYESGDKIKTNYFKGLIHGEYKKSNQNYDEEVGEYYLGFKKGTWKYYHANGALSRKEIYKHKKYPGVPYRSRSYHPDGTLDQKQKIDKWLFNFAN